MGGLACCLNKRKPAAGFRHQCCGGSRLAGGLPSTIHTGNEVCLQPKHASQADPNTPGRLFAASPVEAAPRCVVASYVRASASGGPRYRAVRASWALHAGLASWVVLHAIGVFGAQIVGVCGGNRRNLKGAVGRGPKVGTMARNAAWSSTLAIMEAGVKRRQHTRSARQQAAAG